MPLNYETARVNMVEGQVRPSDVTDRRLLDLMLELPRERFVPKSRRDIAYGDELIDLPGDRYLLPPRVLAKMIQAAEITEKSVVLDIGTGTGYTAGLLGRLASSVIALETDPSLVAYATDALLELSIDNVVVEEGILSQGYPQQAPFDVIFVNGAVPEPSEVLEAQLADRGRLVVILQKGPMGQVHVFRRIDDIVSGRPIFDAAAPLLPGFEREQRFVL